MLTRLAALGFALATLSTGVGCASMSNTGKGAVAGSAIGSVVGTGIGLATGRPGVGAALGGVGGAGIGAAIGADADRDEKARADDVRLAEAEAAIANAPGTQGPLSVEEIKQMAQSRVADDVIIAQIHATGSRYNLRGHEISDLTAAGVSQPVLKAMIASRNAAPTIVRPRPRVIVQEPPPVVFVERPYYGPRYVPYYGPPRPGFGVHWHHH